MAWSYTKFLFLNWIISVTISSAFKPFARKMFFVVSLWVSVPKSFSKLVFLIWNCPTDLWHLLQNTFFFFFCNVQFYIDLYICSECVKRQRKQMGHFLPCRLIKVRLCVDERWCFSFCGIYFQTYCVSKNVKVNTVYHRYENKCLQ